MKYKLIILLILVCEICHSQNITIYCSETTTNSQIFDKGIEYKKGLERVFSNLENSPTLIERDKLNDLIEFLKDEENLAKDIGNDDFEMLKKADVDYVVYSNFSVDPLKSKKYLEIECVRVSGNAIFTKFSFPVISLTTEELDNPIMYEQKLKEVLSKFSFVKDLGILENTQLQEINTRIDNSSKEVVLLRNQLKAVTDYLDMAELNIEGKGKLGQAANRTIIYRTELSSLMSLILEKYSLRILYTQESQESVEKVIQNYPRFPFGYYVKAMHLKKKNDKEWKEYAKEAIKILEYTTSIKSCNHNHHEVLDGLRVMINKF